MAFARKGTASGKIKVLTDKNAKLVASDTNIICPHCHKIVGMKIGDVFAILDKRYVTLKGQICPECKKELE